MAVASLMVVYFLLDFVLLAAFVPAVGSYWASDVASIVAVLVASLIVGFVFGGQINESRLGSVGRIAVLFAVVSMISVIVISVANPYVGPVVEKSLKEIYSEATYASWTEMDRLAYGQVLLLMLVTMSMVLSLVLSFIGLYAGSMLKRGAKS